MSYSAVDSAALKCGCEVLREEEMRGHTTFKIGGPADRFIIIKDYAALEKMLSVLSSEEIPYIIIGNGSNMLVSDLGIRGAVLMLAGELSKIELLEDGETIVCGAGARLSALCTFARDNGLTGLEFAYGIPGTVGGAVYMNAGAYGGEMADVVKKVHHMTRQGEKGFYNSGDLDFSYRHSVYSDSGFVILDAVFKLNSGNKEDIKAKMEELIGRRRDKQPYDMPSAGSTFKRPEGEYAAALIEECGLKGKTVGGAQVSPKHSGFIVNTGDATFKDVTELIKSVKEIVFTQRKIALECEVEMIGEDVK